MAQQFVKYVQPRDKARISKAITATNTTEECCGE